MWRNIPQVPDPQEIAPPAFDEVQAAVDEGAWEFGRLDVVVANAGISPKAHKLRDEPWEAYKQVQAVNVDGAWWTCREASRQMVAQGRGGSIITLASIAGITGVQTGQIGRAHV